MCRYSCMHTHMRISAQLRAPSRGSLRGVPPRSSTATYIHYIHTYRYQLNSELLAEDHSGAYPQDPVRPLTYAFKGFTPDQVRAVRGEQLRQAAEKQEQRIRDKEQEQNWDLVQVSFVCVHVMCDVCLYVCVCDVYVCVCV